MPMKAVNTTNTVRMNTRVNSLLLILFLRHKSSIMSNTGIAYICNTCLNTQSLNNQSWLVRHSCTRTRKQCLSTQQPNKPSDTFNVTIFSHIIPTSSQSKRNIFHMLEQAHFHATCSLAVQEHFLLLSCIPLPGSNALLGLTHEPATQQALATRSQAHALYHSIIICNQQCFCVRKGMITAGLLKHDKDTDTRPVK